MQTLSIFSRRAGLLSLLFVAVVLTGGCAGPPTLRHSFYQYSEAYASTVNEQMLLNLARRARFSSICSLTVEA